MRNKKDEEEYSLDQVSAVMTNLIIAIREIKNKNYNQINNGGDYIKNEIFFYKS
jgi:hypothetical protein